MPKKNHNDINDFDNINDTLFVAGVCNQPAASGNGPAKYMSCVNKKGITYEIRAPLSHGVTIKATDRDNIISYIERGDTIVMQQGKIVKNLTMENLKSRYVNGR